MGAARRWYLGGQRWSPPVYLFQDHGVGSKIARCAMPSASISMRRWNTGGRSATVCMRRFVGSGSIASATPSHRALAAALDASLLLNPLVGFLAADDPRVRGTVAAIERELMIDGIVLRYRSETDIDGLPPGEGFFSAVQLLAGQQLQAATARRRSKHSIRAPALAAQRCRPARRGIRSEVAAASVFSHRRSGISP